MAGIVVLGAGFAGLWSAAGAARALDLFGIARDAVRVTLINRDPWHAIRVRNYEPDLREVRVPLDRLLGPIGVERVIGEVVDIDLGRRTVAWSNGSTRQSMAYDRLIFALGSQLLRPDLPGLSQYAFDVDTYDAAARLNRHIDALPEHPASPGQYTALVVGGGLTGIEAATEMIGKLRSACSRDPDDVGTPRVILADHQPRIGSDMGDGACEIIGEALASLGVTVRPGVSVTALDGGGATLATGERIPAASVVWCTGMRANPLTELFPVERDGFGRVQVDRFMRIVGISDAFAAGDVARAVLDDRHVSVMSCQHARPMGRFAGYNAVADLLGKPMLPLRIDWYVTVLDLGSWGAVYTEGWDRRVAATGASAKKTKQIINRRRIYPPLSGNRLELLDAAAPIVQAPPPFDAQNA